VAILSERLKKAWEEAEFHKQCNVSLTENQQVPTRASARACKPCVHVGARAHVRVCVRTNMHAAARPRMHLTDLMYQRDRERGREREREQARARAQVLTRRHTPSKNSQALNAKLAEAAKKDEEILDLQDQVHLTVCWYRLHFK
jgi:hypothetical protein